MESEGRSPQGGERGDDDKYEPFELQPSVLEAVASLCPEHEAEEIWRVVGPSLVEQAKDLLDEARLHLEIWRELSEDADHVASRGLPEPPLVRERLIQEIRFLANHLRTRGGSSTLGSCGADRNREILDYALTTANLHGDGGAGNGNRAIPHANQSTLSLTPNSRSTRKTGGGRGSGCGRPMSAVSSRDGRDTPLRQATPSSRDGSCSSVLSGLSVENVSLAAIDSTVQYLRDSLEEEIEQRRQDIAFLQECNEGERAFLQIQPRPPPPSLRELRDVGTLLEREVTSTTARGSPLGPSYPSCRVVQPRPPPLECSNKSTASSGGMRRASGVRPRPIQSSPDPVINRTGETVGVCKPRQSSSEVFSPAPRYTGINTAATPTTTHCTSIT